MPRKYTTKPEEEKRIVAGLSISGERLKRLRAHLAKKIGREPTKDECKNEAIDLAYRCLDQLL